MKIPFHIQKLLLEDGKCSEEIFTQLGRERGRFEILYNKKNDVDDVILIDADSKTLINRLSDVCNQEEFLELGKQVKECRMFDLPDGRILIH